MLCDVARAPVIAGDIWCGINPVAGSSRVFTLVNQRVTVGWNRAATRWSCRLSEAIATVESTGQA